MTNQLRFFIFVSVSALTSGCGQPPAPPAHIELEAVSRPTIPLHIEARRQIVVPQAATIVRGGITGVFVVQDERARFRMVRTGKVLPGRKVEILSGLHGDEILVLGQLDSIHDGSPLKVKVLDNNTRGLKDGR